MTAADPGQGFERAAQGIVYFDGLDEVGTTARSETTVPAHEWTEEDAFVAETNIHYPTESSLIRDGIRKTLEVAVLLAG